MMALVFNPFIDGVFQRLKHNAIYAHKTTSLLRALQYLGVTILFL